MTVSSIEVAKDLVDEMLHSRLMVGSVWVYTHETTGITLYSVFTADQLCDIHEAPYVNNPVRIWRLGKWLGNYEYLNSIDA